METEKLINTQVIYNKLKKKIVGQDEYLKKLAVFGYRHQLNLQAYENNNPTVGNNLLVIGPPASGKTQAAHELANIIDIPFYEVDCSNITQTGYKGNMNVEKILTSMVDRLGSRSRRCIVYLDEFDKIFDPCLEAKGEGKGAQQNFLKFFEKNVLTIKDESARHETFIKFDNSCISFIASGSFEYIKEVIRKNRADQTAEKPASRMGFNATGNGNKAEAAEITLTAGDLIANGYMPELIGRFTNVININRLNEKDFEKILLTADDNYAQQMTKLLERQGVKLSTDREFINYVVKEAYKIGTGARGIVNVMNNVYDDCLFEVAADSSICEVIISMKDGHPSIRYNHRRHEKKQFTNEPAAQMNRQLIEPQS